MVMPASGPPRRAGPGAAPSVAVVALDDSGATDADLVGAKAANLVRCAAAGLPIRPGFVVTTEGAAHVNSTSGVHVEIERAWTRLTAGKSDPLVVRSSSTAEDLETSSMAGRFTSVLDVSGWDDFLDALHSVVASATRGSDGDAEPRPMAVLVQRQVDVEMGGVMFGVDPMTGDPDHLVVEVVPARVDDLVGGKVTAARYVLTRHGRLVEHDPPNATDLTASQRRRLAAVARRAADTLGTAQDIEWAFDPEGRLWLLQSRPVTAVAERAASDRVFGPGPVAETFPLPLRRLEEDLWVVPLRDGVERALRTSGAVAEHDLEQSPIVVTVGGHVAMDLELTGIAEGTWTLRRRIDPVQIVRRLVTSWRVGRLRVALPRLCDELVAVVDADLRAVPAVDDLALDTLLDLLTRARRELATVHQYEVLAGMLLHDRGDPLPATLVALDALHEARRRGLSDTEAIARWPVLLSLVPPSLTPRSLPPSAPVAAHEVGSIDALGEREALRLRSRWLQELLDVGVRSIGRRLADDGRLPEPVLVRELTFDELGGVVRGDTVPGDLDARAHAAAGAPLPPRFRLTVSGSAVPVKDGGHRGSGRPAAPGRVVGTARHRLTPGTAKDGHVLVTRHLDPALAPLLPSVDAIVSETGSSLSHLAILARETGVAAVVGVEDALHRFPPGTRLLVDGATGDVHRIGDGDAPEPEERS